jgi:protein PhnA
MSEVYPKCPECESEYTYESGHLLACPDCAHEWSPDAAAEPASETAEADDVVRDAHGNQLQSGDTVQLTKDLKVKGTSTTLKIGTKVKNIRLVDGDHDIDCKVDGIGAMKLKSEFVKKV